MNNKENRAEKLRTIYKNAEAFLFEIAPKGIQADEMEKYFIVPKTEKTKADILYGLLGSLQNRAMMTNTIGLWNEKRAPVFKEIFFNYDAGAILEAYTADSLFECFKEHFNVDSSKKSFADYAKSVISACQFLNKFDSAEDFDTYVMRYYNNVDARIELAQILEKEIIGIGFALACDFLKDIGYEAYAKPDTHLMKIFNELSLCENKPIPMYRTFVEMANAVGKTPYAVDKVFWLIGSGNFYLHNIKVGHNKDKFIEKMKNL